MDKRKEFTLANKQVLLAGNRKHFMNKLKEEIRIAELKIKRNIRTTENLKASASAGKDIPFIRSQIEKNQEANANLAESIILLNKKIDTIPEGGCDVEIEKLYSEASELNLESSDKLLRKEALLTDRELQERSIAEAYSKREYKDNKNEKYLVKSIGREYDRFLDVIGTLPDYITRNLDSMPGNKGYKWRGVTFFGKLPEVPNEPVMVFDKKPEGMMITEITPSLFTVYLKSRDGNKNLITQHRRRLNGRRGPATIFK